MALQLPAFVETGAWFVADDKQCFKIDAPRLGGSLVGQEHQVRPWVCDSVAGLKG